MIKKAVKMQLLKGCEKEYQKRHDEIWPEMVEMLKIHGAISYSIFLDPSTCALYAYLEIEDEERWLKTSKTVVNKKWWDFMSDIMDTNYDNSPSSVELLKIFELEH